jgi:LysW-gamma-L-lysine carboxypeptidase
MESVSLLTGLLQRFSPTGYEADAVNFLVECMQQLGFQAHRDAVGDAVGTIGTGSREILMLGHIDTVPGKITVRQEKDVLFGRGAVDAKGPLASFICAASNVQISPDWRITIIGAVGEEGDSRGAHYLCETYPSPEMVVIGEPSGWNSITIGYKGSFWTEVSITQPASHTASGVTSACDQAFTFWNQLLLEFQALNAGKNRVFDQFSPSIRGMKSTSDGFEDNAVLQINVRLPQMIDLPYMENILMESAKKAGIHPMMRTVDYMPAFLAEKNTLLVKAFISSIRKNGGNPGFKLKTGTSDMNLVGSVWNCPMIAYGAGDSNLDHTANEHISIQEYLQGIQVLRAALQKIQEA